jgi:hypothetical protein
VVICNHSPRCFPEHPLHRVGSEDNLALEIPNRSLLWFLPCSSPLFPISVKWHHHLLMCSSQKSGRWIFPTSLVSIVTSSPCWSNYALPCPSYHLNRVPHLPQWTPAVSSLPQTILHSAARLNWSATSLTTPVSCSTLSHTIWNKIQIPFHGLQCLPASAISLSLRPHNTHSHTYSMTSDSSAFAFSLSSLLLPQGPCGHLSIGLDDSFPNSLQGSLPLAICPPVSITSKRCPLVTPTRDISACSSYLANNCFFSFQS